MLAPRIDDLQTATATLSDRAGVAHALTAALAAIAPRALHAVTFFSGPASLELDAAAAHIEGRPLDVRDLGEVYTTSAVRWNRWEVEPRDRDRFVPVDVRPSDGLRAYWLRHARLAGYRRQVVCVGRRAVALVGSTAIGDADLPPAIWAALQACIAKTCDAIRLAAFAAGALEDIAPVEATAYLSETGERLATAGDREIEPAIVHAAELLRTRSKTRAFTVHGIRYVLRPSAVVRGAEVFELVATRGIALSERDVSLVGWVRRGLTNREVAVMLEVPPSTVKKALERLFARHGASNRVELLRLIDGFG